MESDLLRRLALELDTVFELSESQQQEHLDRLARNDPPLARALADALAADDRDIPVFDQALRLAWSGSAEPAGPTLEPGDRIGPWRLEAELGRGGMGRVWRAARDDGQYRFEVAIKLLAGSLHSDILREQFARERQILADLDHPDIARLVDGGVREDGTPWYAMEFVDGRPLDVYCREAALDLHARLRLMSRVCRAVHHAHTRLVVHRDLKPGNILVDEAGNPYLVDFGLAKLLESAGGESGPMTLMAAATPGYAAPEQQRGEPVGTAADIYALGVTLGELVSGQRVRSHVDGPPLVSRSVDDHRLRRALRGDIDSIVVRAMAEDPAQRYASAEALSSDIERHLEGLPVHARHAGSAYRARKFLRRHWLSVGIGSVAVIMLCLALGVSLVQTQRAETALERASAVQEFLLDVFGAARSQPGSSGIITHRDLTDRAAERLDEMLVERPDARVDLLLAIGRVYRKLGLSGRSQEVLHSALSALDAGQSGRRDPRRVKVLLALGRADYYESDFDAAVDHLSTAERLARAAEMSDELRTRILFELGSSQSRAEQPGAALETLAEAARLAGAQPRPGTLLPRAVLTRAVALRRAGRYEDALEEGQRAVELSLEILGEDHVRTAAALGTVGAMMRRTGRLEQAEAMLRRALEIELESYGQAQSATVNNLAAVLRDRGMLTQSERLYRQALALAEARYGPDSAGAASYRRNLALQQLTAGKTEAAAENLNQAYERCASEYSIDKAYNLHMRTQLAWALAAAGRNGRAGELLEAVFEHGAGEGQTTMLLRRAHRVAAQLALARGDIQSARRHVTTARKDLGPYEVEPHERVRLALLEGDIMRAAGSPQQAREHWQAGRRNAQALLGSAHPLRAELEDRLTASGPCG